MNNICRSILANKRRFRFYTGHGSSILRRMSIVRTRRPSSPHCSGISMTRRFRSGRSPSCKQPESSHARSSGGRKRTSRSPSRSVRGRSSRASTDRPVGRASRNLRLASQPCRSTDRKRSFRDLNRLGLDNQLKRSKREKRETSDRIRNLVDSLTLVTERSFPSSVAVALAFDAPTVTRARRHFTLGDGNVALGALPSVLAVANAPTVVAVSRAQHWTDTLRTVSTLVAVDAIAFAQVTWTVTRAVVGAAIAHAVRLGNNQLHRMRHQLVVVDRQVPPSDVEILNDCDVHHHRVDIDFGGVGGAFGDDVLFVGRQMRHERWQMEAGVERFADRVVVDWRKLGHPPQIVIHFVMISVVVVPGVSAIGQHFKSLFISWHNVIDYITSPPYAILLQPSALRRMKQ